MIKQNFYAPARFLDYAVRKTMAALLVLAGISVVAFLLNSFSPGDPAYLILAADGNIEPSVSEIRETRRELGLDLPLYIQYTRWARRILKADLGRSFVTGEPIRQEIARRLPITLKLAAMALTISALCGVGLGFLTVLDKNNLGDRAGQTLGVALISVPDFWLAIVLINIFAECLRWLPTSGAASFKAFILPAIVLAASTTGSVFRLCRTLLLKEMGKEYILTARSKGLGKVRIVSWHAFINILIPLMTTLGIGFGHMLGGAIIVESIFSVPGMGQLAMNSISHRDYPVIQAYVLYTATLFILVNLILDLLYLMVNPEINSAGGDK